MNILFVTRPIAPPWDEGGKNTVFALAKRMHNHTVHLLTTDFSYGADNIIFESVYTKSGLVSGISLGQKIRLFLRLMKRDDVEIYHFFFKPTPVVATAAKIILSINKKRTVQTVVSVPFEGERLKKTIFADKVVVGSRFMQKRLAEEGIEAELIPFAVDVDEFGEDFDLLDAKKTWDMENSPTILFAGNLHPGKGTEIIVESMPDVVERLPQVKFVFACRFLKTKVEALNLKKIKSKIDDMNLTQNAVFFSKVENMKKLIQAADIAVYPTTIMTSKMDFPLIILEAMAMGKSVIFSDVPPLNELFEKESNVMIEKDNPKQLSTAIISLLTSKEKMRLMGENAKTLVREKFNIESSVHKYLNVYTELLNQ